MPLHYPTDAMQKGNMLGALLEGIKEYVSLRLGAFWQAFAHDTNIKMKVKKVGSHAYK